MTAVGVSLDLFVRLHPRHFKTEQIFNTESIREKTPEARIQQLFASELGCMNVVVGIVRDAISAGDLVLPEGVTPEDVCFGLWSITYGGQSIMAAKPHLSDVGISDGERALRRNQQAIMDGFGWHPLTPEWDYAATRRRILEQVFPEEARAAGIE